MLSSVAGQDHLLQLLPCLPGAHTPTRVPTPPDHPAAHSPQHSLPPQHTHLPHFFPLFFSAVSTHSIPPSHPSTTLKLSLPPTASPVLPPPSHPPPLHHRVPPPPPKRNIPSQPPPPPRTLSCPQSGTEDKAAGQRPAGRSSPSPAPGLLRRHSAARPAHRGGGRAGRAGRAAARGARRDGEAGKGAGCGWGWSCWSVGSGVIPPVVLVNDSGIA